MAIVVTLVLVTFMFCLVIGNLFWGTSFAWQKRSSRNQRTLPPTVPLPVMEPALLSGVLNKMVLRGEHDVRSQLRPAMRGAVLFGAHRVQLWGLFVGPA